ncbi:MAG: NAD(P)-dependent oxidoreductase [Caulobacteraceae bacterium]
MARPSIAWMSADLWGTKAAGAFTRAALASPDLSWVHTASAGFDHPVFGEMVKKGARLTTSHAHAVGIADYVLWGVLDHFQRGPERRAAQAEGAWRRLRYREIAGSTWALFGFGAIGKAVAARARAFGARILAVSRRPAAHPLADATLTPSEAKARLSEADVAVLSLPLSASTRHFADQAFFAAMKAGSVVANVGRGGLLDEAALVAALDAGRPGFAILDVFEVEPLPAQSPLWGHPKVSLTPHASAISEGQAERLDEAFLANLERRLSGAALADEPDPADVMGAT